MNIKKNYGKKNFFATIVKDFTATVDSVSPMKQTIDMVESVLI